MISLKRRVIEKHDTLAYYELREIYMLSGHHEEILFFAYAIAYNTDLPAAYFDLYASIPPDKKGRLHVLNEYYLLLAKEKGFDDAKYGVAAKYKDSAAVPSSEEYLRRHKLYESGIFP